MRQIHRVPMHWFISQMPARPGLGSGYASLPREWQRPSDWSLLTLPASVLVGSRGTEPELGLGCGCSGAREGEYRRLSHSPKCLF